MKIRRASAKSAKPASSRKRSNARRRRIDATDIPPLTEAFFEKATRNPYLATAKRSTTVRLDADVLAWLRSQGSGYQSRINAILRRAMIEEVGTS